MATKKELMEQQYEIEQELKRLTAKRSELVLDKADTSLIDNRIKEARNRLEEVNKELNYSKPVDPKDIELAEKRDEAKDELARLRTRRKQLEEAGSSTKLIDNRIKEEQDRLDYYRKQLDESPTAAGPVKIKGKTASEKAASASENSNLQDRMPTQLEYQNATYQEDEAGLGAIIDKNGRTIRSNVYIIGGELPKGMPAWREVPWESNIRTKTEQDVNEDLRNMSREDRARIQKLLKRYGAWDKPADGSLAYKLEFDNQIKEIYRQMTQVNIARLQNKESAYTLEKFLDAEYTLAEEEETGPRTVTSKSFFSLSGGESKLLLDEYYRRTLGRAATQDELKQFEDIVKKRSERKPSIRSKTYEDGVLTEERTLEPGFGEAEAQLTAFRQAKARPEFAAYQLANTYYDAILAAAQSPINIQRPTS